MALLETQALTKSFVPGVSAVSNVNLAIVAGEIVCLLGPSGCGKTTLLRMIAGLESADSGSVWFEGRELTAVPPHLRDFGMMFQDFALFPHKDVFENIAYGLQMHGWDQEKIAMRVAEMLALVELTAMAHRDVARLSGGEQQRVALARSLAPRPRLLMLDEPLGALDRALRERLMLDLRRILQEVAVTAVYVTHDQTEAFAIADRVVVMNEGRIEQVATPQQLFARPATPFVARFLGFRNLLAGILTETGEVDTPLGRLSLPMGYGEGELTPGTTATVLIRPDALAVGMGSGDRQIILTGPASLTAVSFRGRYFQVWFTIAHVTLMFELPHLPDWDIGEVINLPLAKDRLQLFAL